MLSVFITPWQKPTDCHCAMSRAVRSLTSLSNPAICASPDRLSKLGK